MAIQGSKTNSWLLRFWGSDRAETRNPPSSFKIWGPATNVFVMHGLVKKLTFVVELVDKSVGLPDVLVVIPTDNLRFLAEIYV